MRGSSPLEDKKNHIIAYPNPTHPISDGQLRPVAITELKFHVNSLKYSVRVGLLQVDQPEAVSIGRSEVEEDEGDGQSMRC